MSVNEDDGIHAAEPIVSEDTWTVEVCTIAAYNAWFDLRPTGHGNTAWLTGGFDDEYGRVYGVFLTADELRGLAKVALNIADSLESEK